MIEDSGDRLVSGIKQRCFNMSKTVRRCVDRLFVKECDNYQNQDSKYKKNKRFFVIFEYKMETRRRTRR